MAGFRQKTVAEFQLILDKCSIYVGFLFAEGIEIKHWF